MKTSVFISSSLATIKTEINALYKEEIRLETKYACFHPLVPLIMLDEIGTKCLNRLKYSKIMPFDRV